MQPRMGLICFMLQLQNCYRTTIHMQLPGWGSSITPLGSRVQDAFRLVVVHLISSQSYTHYADDWLYFICFSFFALVLRFILQHSSTVSSTSRIGKHIWFCSQSFLICYFHTLLSRTFSFYNVWTWNVPFSIRFLSYHLLCSMNSWSNQLRICSLGLGVTIKSLRSDFRASSFVWKVMTSRFGR